MNIRGIFLKTLTETDFPGKASWKFDMREARTKEFGKYELRVTRNLNNMDLHLEEAVHTKVDVNHCLFFSYDEIPQDPIEAKKWFIKLIFKAYIEFETHELMENFCFEGTRVFNPHAQSPAKYVTAVPQINAYTRCWRNRVMWEACARIMEEHPEDNRTLIQRIDEWQEDLTKNWKYKKTKIQSYFWSWFYQVKSRIVWSWKEKSVTDLKRIPIFTKQTFSGIFNTLKGEF